MIFKNASATLALLLALGASPAWARKTGNNVECHNCHDAGKIPVITVTANPATVAPGAVVMLTIGVSRVNGDRAGFFITNGGKGEFQLTDAVGTRLIAKDDNGPAGVTHTMPKSATTGSVTFQVAWKAPATKGAVDFDVYGVSATGVIKPGTGEVFPEDDGMGFKRLGFSFGCTGKGYYPDDDKDGYGREDKYGQLWSCSLVPGLSLTKDDCDDNDAKVNPKGTEICNQIDDNCDGMADEGIVQATLYRDADFDGYGNTADTMTMMNCGEVFGYSAKGGDCNDKEKNINPGAMEICNQVDDDCDGRPDNGVQPACGVGWCRRVSATCDVAACKPGTPRAETCNGIDDDCNGQTDEGSNLCPAGQSCQNGLCANGGGAGGADGGSTDAGGGRKPDAGAQGGNGGGGSTVGSSGCSAGGREGAPYLSLLGMLVAMMVIRQLRSKPVKKRTGETERPSWRGWHRRQAGPDNPGSRSARHR